MGYVITVDLSGPVFDGRAAAAMDRGAVAARHRVAATGAALAASYLAGSIRHEVTGFAVASITMTDSSRVYQSGSSWVRDIDTKAGGFQRVSRTYSMPVVVGPDETVVTTENATYGPWLEGTGSRNATTRFKGYHSFRMAAQTLNGMAEDIASTAYEPYVAEMNA